MCRIAKEIIKKTNLAKEVKNVVKKIECKKTSREKVTWNIPKKRRIKKTSWVVK